MQANTFTHTHTLELTYARAQAHTRTHTRHLSTCLFQSGCKEPRPVGHESRGEKRSNGASFGRDVRLDGSPTCAAQNHGRRTQVFHSKKGRKTEEEQNAQRQPDGGWQFSEEWQEETECADVFWCHFHWK